MKIYSEKKCSQVVSACIDQYPDAMRMPVLECWKKYKLVACIIVLLLSVMLGVATVKTYKDVALFVKNTFSCWRLMVLVIGFLTIIVIETLCICIHEFIHMLEFKIFCCKSVLVYTKKNVYVFCFRNWLVNKKASADHNGASFFDHQCSFILDFYYNRKWAAISVAVAY